MATYAAFKHVELYNIGSGKKRFVSSLLISVFNLVKRNAKFLLYDHSQLNL